MLSAPRQKAISYQNVKALILIDSFKGSMTSAELGSIAVNSFKKHGIDGVFLPISDGGDGFLDTVDACFKTKLKRVSIRDPLGREVESFYRMNEKKQAFIEMAKTSGLDMVSNAELNPWVATSHGLGDVINDAIHNGASELFIGLGGTATTDAGLGMLEALGVKFYHQHELLKDVKPKDFLKIDHIDTSSLIPIKESATVTILSDVLSPLLGPQGAVYQFSLQKGAQPKDLEALEQHIAHCANLLILNPNKEIAGGGAAGGVGFTLQVLFNATVKAGIDTILDWMRFEERLQNIDVILTGEGKIDTQTLEGKVVSGILKRNKDKKIILVCALNELLFSKEHYPAIENIYSIVPKYATKTQSLLEPKRYFEIMMDDLSQDLARRDVNASQLR